jgi:integrase/recombinase XerD
MTGTRSGSARVAGPLTPYASGFRAELAARGYAPPSSTTHMLLMAWMSDWLTRQGLSAGDLTATRVGEFFARSRAAGHRFPRSAKGFMPLLSYLRDADVVPAAPAADLTEAETLLAQFRGYLLEERGLAVGTVAGYVFAASLFLKALGYPGSRGLEDMKPSDDNDFLLQQLGRRSVASAKCLVSGLRSLLRFLHVQGITAASLAAGVPAVAGWSGSSVPKAVDAHSVRALLRSCDRQTAKGRRDFAVLMLLTRLGVRVGEVARLRLTDVDWHGGQILIRGKDSRLEHLPLPVDVGEALASYVQHGRSRGAQPSLFLRVLAPHGPLTPSAIKVIVNTAYGRAGLPPLGAHRLRHTVASELLRHGAGLPEIAQLLRHRSLASTAIYAKVDTEALRRLARPWPGGVQ